MGETPVDTGGDAERGGTDVTSTTSNFMDADESASLVADDEGVDCYADDREALFDYVKFYNNEHLSDVALFVDECRYAAHKIVLCRSSEVFDRMLDQKWTKPGYNKLTLSEDVACQSVFGEFLRFFYCNHVVLAETNALPLLVLADKYCVHSLRKVCVDYAIKKVLPRVNLKTLLHVWYKYATTAYHRELIDVCVEMISPQFYLLIGDDNWDDDWLRLDVDQMKELLKSSHLVMFTLERWLHASLHSSGLSADALLTQLLPLIRFSFMSGSELKAVEASEIARHHAAILIPRTHLALMYDKLPFSQRLSPSEFNDRMYLLREYTDVRWDKKIRLKLSDLGSKHAEHHVNEWEWTVVFSKNVFSGGTYSFGGARTDELSIELKGVDVNDARNVDYLLQFVDGEKILRSFNGRKQFTKSRTIASLDLDNIQLSVDQSLVRNDHLNLQLFLRPIQ